MSIGYVTLFTFTVFVASLIPGPTMLLALNNGMQHGIRKSLVSALGNMLVTLLQAGLSVAGLGTILMASHRLFSLVKWAGAIYLLYLGIRFFFSQDNRPVIKGKEGDSEKGYPHKLFLQAILVTAANPKALLFFTAVFPQFINREGAFLLQSLILLGIVCLVAFLCFMIYAIGGERFHTLLSQPRLMPYLKKIFGLSFIGAGIGLAVSS
ncbi:MAG: LysE family translocator [Spirochaetales bacterium]|nr:LysE family translocator [Spirochaetales bacterium]